MTLVVLCWRTKIFTKDNCQLDFGPETALSETYVENNGHPMMLV